MLSANQKKDTLLTFEELGIDRLFIDEAHKFKNLFYVTKMTRVAGLPQTASERAFDLFLKVQHVQGKGGSVIFATGTPISNSMAEMFTMQRYLQMAALRKNQLQHFDSWAGTFGETVTALELSPGGSGYRLNTRFARFVNLPELMQQFRQVTDVQTAETLKLPVPKMAQGKPITVSAPASTELKRYVDSLIARVEAIKSRRVDMREDNMLNVTTDGRKAALDLRLIFGDAPDHPDSKVNCAVEKIHQIWLNSMSGRGSQLVFCDLSTPRGGKGASKRADRFSVYEDIREKLCQRGIPHNEIAFIQDYDEEGAKASLFHAVREGRVRILLGSTQKMGEGTNVQKRLVALHHLDAPWRPADIEQREGRILRQGNQNEEVHIFRYVTEGSFDAYMWQTLETKCRFIAQVMTGDATVRSAEDVDAAALTYAEVKAIASGNPLVLEKASVDAEMMRLTQLKKQHSESLYRSRLRIKSLTESIGIAERGIANISEDLKTRTSTRGDRFSMTIQNVVFNERAKAGRELVSLASLLKPFQTTKPIGAIGGFSISLRRDDNRVYLLIHGKQTYSANVSENASGTIASLEHALDGMEDQLRERRSDFAHYQKQREDLSRQINQPFEHEAKLSTTSLRQQKILAKLDLTGNQTKTTVVEKQEQTQQAVRNRERFAQKPQYAGVKINV